ncbi:protein of unknown function (plasmid) [Thermococcus nautili]|nr:protein of unknown function [Thermococcus nautili]
MFLNFEPELKEGGHMKVFPLDYMKRWGNLILWKERDLTGGFRVFWRNDMHSITISERDSVSLVIEDRWHGVRIVRGRFDSLETALKFLENLIGISIVVVEVDYRAPNS